RAPPGSDRAAMGAVGRPAALHVEMQPPPPSVARSLRLSAGQPAAKVTVRFDDPATGRPAGLTVAVLRPELFRIVVQTAEAPVPGGEAGSVPGAWARTTEGWDPLRRGSYQVIAAERSVPELWVHGWSTGGPLSRLGLWLSHDGNLSVSWRLSRPRSSSCSRWSPRTCPGRPRPS